MNKPQQKLGIKSGYHKNIWKFIKITRHAPIR
jgi:hypothetical protein